MKESVKIDTDVVRAVKKRIKETKQTIGGFIEIAAQRELAGGIIGKIKEDPELFRAWKDNIAMSIKDEFSRYRKEMDKRTLSYSDMHIIANRGAENFLELLIK